MDSGFDPAAMPNLSYKSDRLLKANIHNSQNKIPSLVGQMEHEPMSNGSQASSYLLDRPNDDDTKVISFPKDYGKHLLSSEAQKSSISSMQPNQSTASRPGTRGQGLSYNNHGHRSGSRTCKFLKKHFQFFICN
jgi:hypothetical protein